MSVTILKSVLAPAADYDLTDLATVKDELNIPTTDTSNDIWLGRAISQVSAIVSRYCSRVFLPELLLETQYIDQDPYPYQTPGGIAPLQLTRWPVLNLVSVSQVTATGTTQALVQGTDFAVDFDKGQLIRLNPFTGVTTLWEALPTIIEYSAGYGAVVEEDQTLPATPGPYTVTVDNAATFSFDGGVAYANGTEFTAVLGTPVAAGEYSVALATGIYSFNAADQGAPIVIDYGFSNIPDDLIDVVLRVVTQRFKQKDRDPMLMSINQPGVGEKRWWVGGSAGQNGALPPEITGLLDGAYRVPRGWVMANEIAVELTGERKLGLVFDEFPTKLRGKLKSSISELTDELLARVRSAAPNKTGKLQSEIRSQVFDDAKKITGRVSVSEEFAKAGALEYGGANRSFNVKGHAEKLGHLWARKLNEPLTVFVEAHDRTLGIAARRFLRGPAQAMSQEIISEMRDAVDKTVTETAGE